MSGVGVLVAHDYSGSTDAHAFYHSKANEIYSRSVSGEFAGRPHAFYVWNHTIAEVSETEYRQLLLRMDGCGCTCPSVVARTCRELEFHGVLVLITDGQVYEDQVREVDVLLRDWKFEHVHCHVIDTSVSAYSQMNLSVTSAFTRGSPHTIRVYRKDLPEEQYDVSHEDFDTLRQLGDVHGVDDLRARMPRLVRAVTANTMGSEGNPELKEQLIALRKRVVASLSAASSAHSQDDVEALREALVARRVEEACDAARRIATRYYDITPGVGGGACAPDWDRELAQMISMCEGAVRRDFSIDLVRAASVGIISTPLSRQPTAPAPAPLSDIADTDAAILVDGVDVCLEDFECPISFEQVPSNNVVLLLARPDALPCVLASTPKHVVNDVLLCPLNVFKYPDLVRTLAECLDHPIGVPAFRGAYGAGKPFVRSPFTRRHLYQGGVFLGTCPEHVKSSNWSLAHMLNHGRQAGNMDMWLAVVYFVIKNKEASCAHLADSVLPALEAHLRYRMHTSRTFATLVGSPQFVTTSMPLGCAMWFTHASPRVMHAYYRPEADPLRLHAGYWSYFVELLRLTQYPMLEECLRHASVVRCMLRVHRDHKQHAVRLASVARCLFHDVHVIAGVALGEDFLRDHPENAVPWIPIDAPPQQHKVIENLRLAGYGELAEFVDSLGIDVVASVYDLVASADAGSAKGIALPLDVSAALLDTTARAAAPFQACWPYLCAEDMQRVVFVVPIHENTCRPVTYPSKRASWEAHASAVWGRHYAERMYSTEKWFAEFVVDLGRYPTGAEYQVYLYQRVCQPNARHARQARGRFPVLPVRISHCTQETFRAFAHVMGALKPAEFVRRYQASSARATRAQMDGSAANALRAQPLRPGTDGGARQ